ncbi:hypothetical protein B0H13DRAFT_2022997 [Mycena leptocephala]|nr:hypothetical protein B0H13DRAFT_2022997 [Mycena leptocephala]
MLISLPFFLDVLLLLFTLSQVTLSFGSVLSATIDDAAGDSNTGVLPIYSPLNAFSPNSDCDGCLIRADPGKAFDGSWHDSSQFGGAAPVSVTLSFTGTTIDVFCILANQIPGADTTTDLAFTLDGSTQKPFSHNPDSTSDYEYGVNVFNMSGLTQSAHQLVIATNNPSGSLLLFDYARYSYEVPDITTTAGTTNVVTETSITHVTTTDGQEIPTTQTFSASLPHTSSSIPSGKTTPPASSPKNSSPTSVSSAPASSIPASPPGPSSPGTSSSSSLAPAVAATSHGFNYVPVFAGTLIPIFLIAVIGVIFCRRRRARRSIPDTESQSGHSAAPMFGSRRSHSVYNDEASRPPSGSHRGIINIAADNMNTDRAPFDAQVDETSATNASDIQMREKPDSDTGRYPSACPTEHNNPPALSPSASLYTFDASPPPVYSPERPLPILPSPPFFQVR